MYTCGFFALHSAAETGNLELFLEQVGDGVSVDAGDEFQVRPIHVAALNGHLPIVRELLARRCNVNTKAQRLGDECGVTALHLAAQHEDAGVAAALLAAGAGVNARDKRLATPLHVAVRLGNAGVARALLAAGAKADAADDAGATPLLLAAERRFTGLAELLVAHGADVGARGDDGLTGLHLAAQSGDVATASLLLRAGADVNAIEVVRFSPLHLALQYKHWHVAELLLGSGADVFVKDEALCTPLHTAAYFGAPDEQLQSLMEKGVGVSEREQGGRVALHLAAERSHPRVAGFLLRNGADANSADNCGVTPLHIAASTGDLSTVELLISHGADVNSHLFDLRTPLHYAVGYHHLDICKSLLSQGADASAADVRGVTPLHLAVFDHCPKKLNLAPPGDHKSKIGIIKILVDYGANVNAKQSFGTESHTYDATPLHAAIKCKDVDAVKCLLNCGACYDAKLMSVLSPITTFQMASWSGCNTIFPFLTLTQNLFNAVEKGDCAGIESCVRQGAIVNSGSVKHGTPLIYASWKGLIKVVDILIKNGADVNLGNSNNVTPLHYAAQFGHNDVVCLLLQHGGIYDVKTKSKNTTPLDFSVKAKKEATTANLRLVKHCFELVGKGDDKFVKDLQVIANKLPVNFLLALVNCKNTKGESLHDIATKTKSKGISLFLQTVKKYIK